MQGGGGVATATQRTLKLANESSDRRGPEGVSPRRESLSFSLCYQLVTVCGLLSSSRPPPAAQACQICDLSQLPPGISLGLVLGSTRVEPWQGFNLWLSRVGPSNETSWTRVSRWATVHVALG